MTEMLTRPPESQDALRIPVQDLSHANDIEVVIDQPVGQMEMTLPAVVEQIAQPEATEKKSDLLGDDDHSQMTQMIQELEAGNIPEKLKLKRDFNEGSKAHDQKQLALIEDFKATSAEALGKHEKAEAAAAAKEAANQHAADWNAERDAAREQAKTTEEMIDKELYKVQLQIGEKRLNADIDKYRAEATAKVNEKLGIIDEPSGPTVTEQRTAAAEASQAGYAELLRDHDKKLSKAATEKQLLKDAQWSEKDPNEVYDSAELEAIDEKIIEAENKLTKARALNDTEAEAEAWAEINQLHAEEQKIEADQTKIAQLEAKRDALQAELDAKQETPVENAETDEEIAEEIIPVSDMSEKGIRNRLKSVYAKAGASLTGLMNPDRKGEYTPPAPEVMRKRRIGAALVLGATAVVSVLAMKGYLNGDEANGLAEIAAENNEAVTPVAETTTDLIPKEVATPAAELLAAAEVTQNFTETALQSGDNPWSIAEQTLINQGIPHPTDFEIDALKDSIMELNGLDEEEAKNLKPGFKLKIPR